VLAALLSALPVWAQDEPPEVLELDPAADPLYLELPNPAFPSPQLHGISIERGTKIEAADLAPYFASGKRAEAKAAFDAGNWNKARALLDGEKDDAPVRYLRALAALRAADYAFASKEFAELSKSYGPMADKCRLNGASAYEMLRDYAAAGALYEAVPQGARQWPDARMGLSRCKRLTRDWKASIDVLGTLPARPAPPYGRDLGAEALLFLADAWGAKKDKDPKDKKAPEFEREALLKLWALHPVHPWEPKAEARLGEIAKVPDEWKVARAEQLIEAHRNAQGVAMLEPLMAKLKIPDPNACRAQAAYGKAMRKLRKHAKAVEVLAAVVKDCKDPDLKARALYTYSYSKGILEPVGSINSWLQLAQQFPGHPYADDALFFAADAFQKAGNDEKALEAYDQLIARYPDGDQYAEGVFRQFWILRQQGKAELAVARLDALSRRFVLSDDAYERERADYWRGRMHEDNGDPKAAVVAYASIVQQHPASYYGLISAERIAALDPAESARLQELVRPPKEGNPVFPLYTGPLGEERGFMTAVELLRLGFEEQVSSEVLGLDRAGLPPDSVRLLVTVLHLAKEERAAHGVARLWLKGDLSGRITAANRAFWEIAYPNAFRDLILKHSEAADKLDPDLLQALMREESALDPRALSWAGALGLCQLMPATAAGVAMQLKLKRPSTEMLLEPDLNIRLGARYLSDLIIRQKNVRQYALASYNAGEGAVSRWRKAAGPNAKIDEWVEMIPLAETRGYVKRVLRSWVTYRLLYGQGASPMATGTR
jgi:soluble lytic murein transglycosylase